VLLADSVSPALESFIRTTFPDAAATDSLPVSKDAMIVPDAALRLAVATASSACAAVWLARALGLVVLRILACAFDERECTWLPRSSSERAHVYMQPRACINGSCLCSLCAGARTDDTLDQLISWGRAGRSLTLLLSPDASDNARLLTALNNGVRLRCALVDPASGAFLQDQPLSFDNNVNTTGAVVLDTTAGVPGVRCASQLSVASHVDAGTGAALVVRLPLGSGGCVWGAYVRGRAPVAVRCWLLAQQGRQQALARAYCCNEGRALFDVRAG
jgi:hypothetical protein